MSCSSEASPQTATPASVAAESENSAGSPSIRIPQAASRCLIAPVVACIAGLLAAGAAGAQPGPALVLDASLQTSPGLPVAVPLGFANHGHAITALAFSFDLDPAGFAFDPTDADLDGVPDAVTLPAGMPPVLVITYDPGDPDGELDVLMADLSGTPLAEGVILEVELTPSQSGIAADWIDFSDDPAPSFSNAQGEDVCGTTQVLGSGVLFADGFESGTTCAWSGSLTS